MTVDLNRPIPKKVIKVWGEKSPAAFDIISKELVSIGFVGPLSWEQLSSIPYYFDTGKTIRTVLSLSKCGSNVDAALFDSVVSIWSKTIHDRTTVDDPWHPIGSGYAKWNNGYVPCLTYRLSHIKWAQHASEYNPAWAMTSEICVSAPNAIGWLSDFESLLFPLLIELRSDSDLMRAMSAALSYIRPSWVKSDGPRFVNLPELLVALRRGGTRS